MQDEDAKIFKVRGEYKMSEEDNFKTAKSAALDSAEKNLGIEVEKFLRERITNLDDNDIADISSRFLKKSEPAFVRENLPDDEMIFYAELNAEINLTAFNNFLKNFSVFKLEKKVEKLQADLESLQLKFTRLIVNLRDFIKYVSKLDKTDTDVKVKASSYLECGNIFLELKEYGLAIAYFKNASEKDSSISLEEKLLPVIEALTREIKLNPNDENLYDTRGYAYESLKRYDEAIADYTQIIKLNPNDPYVYYRRSDAYKAIGEIEKAEKDFAKGDEILGL